MQALPLVEAGRVHAAGWCTIGGGLLDSPEVEIVCGGLNMKTPEHVAVWRQGNLMHFGFEQSPSEFNDTGRALLANTIVYAARFREDRPSFLHGRYGERSYARSRDALRRLLDRPAATPKELAAAFADEPQRELSAKTADEAKAWIRESLDFLGCDARGRLLPDADAQALGIALDDAAFGAHALAAAEREQTAVRALALLARRIPEGPGAGATAAAWRAFLGAETAWLYFTESGGYVWRLDPLAKKRRVPTAELRGSRRAG